MSYVATNKASSTVGANFNATATTITLATGEGARFPSPTGGDYTLITLQNTGGAREIICIVGRSSDTLTVGIPGSTAANVAGRNYETIYGMAAAAWVIGDVVSCRPTAKLIVDAHAAGASAATAQADATTGIANAATAQATANAALPKAGGVMTGDIQMGTATTLIFEGATADAFETTLTVVDPTADRTVTLPDETGTVALIGVKEVIGCFPAGAMKPSTTSGAAPLAWDESATNKLMSGYLAFDASAVEYAQFSFRAPNALNESTGFTARFIWKHAATTVNFKAMWQIEMQAQGDGDTLDSAWGTAVTVMDTGGAETKRYISDETATITPGGTWAAGDEIIVRVSRLATDGTNDTLAVGAHLLEVILMATYAVSTEA